MSLICRLYDVTDGAVHVDGIDVRDYDTEQLWSAIGLVPQRGYLFSGTVADNLRYGKADATDEEMWEALRVASADDFVRAHADGLAMPVAQGGINFSGGQRQRLAIARAVIRRPAIYLFDDAFSALDVHTDARVRAALREVSADATVVDCVATHFDGRRGRPDRRRRRRPGGGRRHPRDRCWPTCPTYAEFADSQSVAAGRPAMTAGPMRSALAGADRALPRLHGLGDPPGQAAHPAARADRDGALCSVSSGSPSASSARASSAMPPTCCSTVSSAVSCPPGITKEQAIAAARARGDNTFADLLSGMNVVPGRGVDFDAVGRTLLLALGLYLVAALLIWIQARLLNVDVQRTMVALRSDVEDKVHRLPLSLLRHPATRRGAEPGHQRRRQHPDVAVDDDQPAVDVAADRRRGAGDDADDLAAADAHHGRHGAAVAVVDPRDRAALAAAVRRAVGNTGRLNAHIEETYSGFTVVKTSVTGRSPRRSSATSTTTSTTPASAPSSSRVWSHPRRPSSATSATSRWRSSAACRWRRARSRSAVEDQALAGILRVDEPTGIADLVEALVIEHLRREVGCL